MLKSPESNQILEGRLEDTALKLRQCPRQFRTCGLLNWRQLRVLAAAWSACYTIRPSSRFFKPVNEAANKNRFLQKTYSRALVQSQNTVSLILWLKYRDGTKHLDDIEESHASLHDKLAEITQTMQSRSQHYHSTFLAPGDSILDV